MKRSFVDSVAAAEAARERDARTPEELAALAARKAKLLTPTIGRDLGFKEIEETFEYRIALVMNL